MLLKSEYNLLEVSEANDGLQICILTERLKKKNFIKFKPTNKLAGDNTAEFFKLYNIQSNFTNRFVKIDNLGKGGYSEVSLVQDFKTDKLYAAKKITFVGKENKPLYPVQVSIEIKAMRDLKSDNVPKIYEVFQNGKEINIIMEYIKGCTLRMFIKHIKVNKKIALCILWSLTQIIYKMHMKGLCHRDIKPLNIIIKDFDPEKAVRFDLKDITSKHRLYLIDYGLTMSPKYEKYDDLKLKICGTSGYMPPELLSSKNNQEKLSFDETKYDIFSVGIIIYEMISGRNPFISVTSRETLLSNRKGNISFNRKN